MKVLIAQCSHVLQETNNSAQATTSVNCVKCEYGLLTRDCLWIQNSPTWPSHYNLFVRAEHCCNSPSCLSSFYFALLLIKTLVIDSDAISDIVALTLCWLPIYNLILYKNLSFLKYLFLFYGLFFNYTISNEN